MTDLTDPVAATPRPAHHVDGPLASPAPRSVSSRSSGAATCSSCWSAARSARATRGSVLGLMWSYINPLSQLFIYWFVFGIIMGRGKVENFAIHVFAGMIIVHFFIETFNAGTRSIVRNKALVQKMAAAAGDVPGRLDAGLALPHGSAAGDPRGDLPLLGLDARSRLPGRVPARDRHHRPARHGAGPDVQRRERLPPRLEQLRLDPHELRALRGPDDLPVLPGRRPLRLVRPVLPAQPDRGRGAARAAGVLARHDQRPGRDACAEHPRPPLRVLVPRAGGLGSSCSCFAQRVFTRFENRIPERL